MALVPCTSCERHIRISETACPFCVIGVPARRETTRLPQTRLGRGARFAFGAAVALSINACGGDDDRPATDAAVADTGSAVDSGTDGGATDAGSMDAGTTDAGGEDAGLADAGMTDAGEDAGPDGGGGLLYGAPPPDGLVV